MAILNFNYEQAIRQAARISDIAHEMLSLANTKYENTIGSISTCWKGEASSQFINHCVNTQTDIRTQAEKLKDLADKIRRAAIIIREAEEKALAAQQNTGSGGGISGGGSGGSGGGRF